MAKKVIVGIVATVLIGVVCAGTIIALVNSTQKTSSHSNDNSSSLSAASKSMTAMCSTALHKDSCESTISKYRQTARQHLMKSSKVLLTWLSKSSSPLLRTPLKLSKPSRQPVTTPEQLLLCQTAKIP